MRNDDDSQEHDGTPSVRRCGHCGDPLLSQRRGAKFCSRECKELARARRRRASKRVTAFRRKHPREAASLDELYRRAKPPVRRADVDPVYSDENDLPPGDDDGQDDGGGYLNDSMHVYQEVERIRARYARLIAPMLATQTRNGGVRLPAIVRLEAERDEKVNQIMKAHWKAEAYDRAEREAPRYRASAHERAVESAALAAFGNDLRRGHRGVSQPTPAGRPTRDVFLF
jgi:hypothetical protein